MHIRSENRFALRSLRGFFQKFMVLLSQKKIINGCLAAPRKKHSSVDMTAQTYFTRKRCEWEMVEGRGKVEDGRGKEEGERGGGRGRGKEEGKEEGREGKEEEGRGRRKGRGRGEEMEDGRRRKEGGIYEISPHRIPEYYFSSNASQIGALFVATAKNSI